MSTLYEIGEEFKVAFRSLEEMIEGGDIDQECMDDTLDGITEEGQVKCINIAKYIKNLAADIDQIKKAEEDFKKRRKSKEAHVSRLTNYVHNFMKVSGKDKFESPLVVLSIKKTPAKVEILGDVPKDYSTHKPEEWNPDKRLIAKDLKAGKELSFAKMGDQGDRLEIK